MKKERRHMTNGLRRKTDRMKLYGKDTQRVKKDRQKDTNHVILPHKSWVQRGRDRVRRR